MTANQKVRNAKDTLATAQSAVSKARSGFQHEVAAKTDEVKKNPLVMTLIIILGLTVVGAIIVFVRNQKN